MILSIWKAIHFKVEYTKHSALSSCSFTKGPGTAIMERLNHMDLDNHDENPKIVVAPNVVVYSPRAVYSERKVQLVFNCFLGFLLLQYISFFFTLTFEDISNRPGICIVADFCVLITVSMFTCCTDMVTNTI